MAFVDIDQVDPANGSKDTCPESFRCVSRVSRFGRNHIGDVIPMPDTSVVGQEPELYEWNCPYKREWKESRFSSGDGDDECKTDKDCLCIQRGSPNMHSELRDGEEVIVGEFKTASKKEPDKTDLKRLRIIPHYQIRDFGATSLDLDNPHTTLGMIKRFGQTQWLDKYKDNAEKVQWGLDNYHDVIEKSYQEKMRLADEVAKQEKLDAAEAQLDLMTIRRFQILSNDCVNMRDTVAKLAPQAAKEGFAPTGERNGYKLRCLKEGDACRQLNCYVGFHALPFLQRIQKLKTKLEAVVSEQDAPVGGTEDEDDKVEAAASSKDGTTIGSSDDHDAAHHGGTVRETSSAQDHVAVSSLGTTGPLDAALLSGKLLHFRPAGRQRVRPRLNHGRLFL